MRDRTLPSCVLGVLAAATGCATAPSENRSADTTPFARFAAIGSLVQATAEVSGVRSMPEGAVPDATRYAESPVVGTFKSNGLVNLRMVESTFFDLGGRRELVLGLGLDSLSTTDSLGAFEKKSGGQFDFQTWSLLLESGLRKRIASEQSVEILTSLMWGLGGKAHYRYRGRDTTGLVREVSVDDEVTRSWRFHLSGRYVYSVLSFLELGVQAEGYYGSFLFDPSSRSASVQGSVLGLVLQLSID